MHNVLEGALPFEVKELIRYLISKKTMSLLSLNEAMGSFPYAGLDARNKPTPIGLSTLTSRDHLLKQTGKLAWGWCSHAMYMYYLLSFTQQHKCGASLDYYH